ncbi:hypothetical protein PU560_10125 [Georgenia sp. 10Sc9-8]|uniref:Uncharacterized protein n=1 Tax=Georgenia halotolerans TaxID=3028317 RepID=A0ABT5TXP5_9MICO|nr:hypothetical protein [Georgenia halotolerans]
MRIVGGVASSDNATRVLRDAGIDAANLSGGALTLGAVRPDWRNLEQAETAVVGAGEHWDVLQPARRLNLGGPRGSR